MFFAITIVVVNSLNMFNTNELKESAIQLMDLGVGVQDVFIAIQKCQGCSRC